MPLFLIANCSVFSTKVVYAHSGCLYRQIWYKIIIFEFLFFQKVFRFWVEQKTGKQPVSVIHRLRFRTLVPFCLIFIAPEDLSTSVQEYWWRCPNFLSAENFRTKFSWKRLYFQKLNDTLSPFLEITWPSWSTSAIWSMNEQDLVHTK